MLDGFYRKTYLTAGERLFQPGTGYPTFDLHGLRYGINICYDTNFPEAANAVASQGARLLLVPSQNMMKRQARRRVEVPTQCGPRRTCSRNRHVARFSRRDGRKG